MIIKRSPSTVSTRSSERKSVAKRITGFFKSSHLGEGRSRSASSTQRSDQLTNDLKKLDEDTGDSAAHRSSGLFSKGKSSKSPEVSHRRSQSAAPSQRSFVDLKSTRMFIDNYRFRSRVQRFSKLRDKTIAYFHVKGLKAFDR